MTRWPYAPTERSAPLLCSMIFTTSYAARYALCFDDMLTTDDSGSKHPVA